MRLRCWSARRSGTRHRVFFVHCTDAAKRLERVEKVGKKSGNAAKTPE